ncbi:N-formylglutamate deformylase [Roseobacter denitrificans]|uniref:N-formylglutamate amidohydrolase, putative n=1 Tax=Roseobacter denitrificans (strain ATCC 33942 / OCh 114) TaxID=375451 RepID=Q162E1_ROSDO|nr:N-formylglutamate deformylase [Roseobacter denitrificans]ABG33152.1 N-formylglutamate amidohydrolase, putative [Roseobacter denitrificans OCh 114]AVL52514.1 N-formylglutamate deformylase [Roseobacter denitrificans]SFG29061.1 formiminoglutamase [Roseobacter denitrificans OCh 114]
MTPVSVHQGSSPIVLGFPHTGTYVPDDIAARLNDNGRLLADTDWHIDRLYGGLLADATTVTANFHRYVIDANRDPEGESLYPGQNTTTLIPLTDFDGRDIWDTPPDEADIDTRRRDFHAPYHAALAAEMARVQDLHGVAILYDCHSIRSHIPFLFDGVLPDLNIGTNSGATCAPRIEQCVWDLAAAAPAYTSVLNARFKGGWTTRHYGRPAQGWHAIQMEIAQSAYLESEAAPWTYDDKRAARLRLHLAQMLNGLANLAPELRT